MSDQDDSTKNTKKKSARSQIKYPALDKKYNLKRRQDYMEPDYINGVKNDDGDLVIRPLNEEEKEFLNKFYEETVNANFLHSDELRDIHNQIKELEQIENPTEEDLEQHMYLRFLYEQQADDSLLYSGEKQQKKIYGENNARNRDLYNRAKASNILTELNNETYDECQNEYINYERKK